MSSIQNKQKPFTNETKKNIQIYLGLPIVGALITLLGQQFFFDGNKKSEEKIKLQS